MHISTSRAARWNQALLKPPIQQSAEPSGYRAISEIVYPELARGDVRQHLWYFLVQGLLRRVHPALHPDDRFDFTASPEIDFSASLKCSSPACRFF